MPKKRRGHPVAGAAASVCRTRISRWGLIHSGHCRRGRRRRQGRGCRRHHRHHRHRQFRTFRCCSSRHRRCHRCRPGHRARCPRCRPPRPGSRLGFSWWPERFRRAHRARLPRSAPRSTARPPESRRRGHIGNRRRRRCCPGPDGPMIQLALGQPIVFVVALRAEVEGDFVVMAVGLLCEQVQQRKCAGLCRRHRPAHLQIERNYCC